MAEKIRMVDYYYIQVPNKPGVAAKALRACSRAGVNLLAFTGFPRGRGSQLDFIPDDSKAFVQVARKAGWKLSAKKTGFLVQGGDRRGAGARLLGKLAKADVNITAVDAVTAGKRRYGAILWVKPQDLKKAAKVLKARR